MLVLEEKGKPEFPVKKNLAGDEQEPTLKKDAGVNVPGKRWLLKQYSYLLLKRFVIIFDKLSL